MLVEVKILVPVVTVNEFIVKIEGNTKSIRNTFVTSYFIKSLMYSALHTAC